MFKRMKEIFEAPERLDFIADCVVKGGEAFENFQKIHKKQHRDLQDQFNSLDSAVNTNLSRLNNKLSDLETKSREKDSSVQYQLKALEEKLDTVDKILYNHRKECNEFEIAHWTEILKLKGSLEEYKKSCAELYSRLNDLEYKATSKVFQSGKSHLASDELDEVPDDAEVDSITLTGKPIEYLIKLLEKSSEAETLIKSQKRFTNRLIRLLRLSVEDPTVSVIDDLRKAEKWKKVMNKKLRNYREKYEREQAGN